MTDFNNPPSIDPAARGDLAGTVRLILTKYGQATDDMLPAKIIAYNRATNRASVQPLISMVTTRNTIVQSAQIASIPVLQLGGGGFVLSFPIQTGDIGWIKANDRDISLFLQFLKEAKPNTARLHSFEDAVFIPDSMMRGVTIASEDANNVVLQNLDGTVKISLFNDKVKITAPTLEVIATHATFSGDMTVTGNVTGGGISLTGHRHGGVQTGGGNTGTPI